jgi:hypothetical protein
VCNRQKVTLFLVCIAVTGLWACSQISQQNLRQNSTPYSELYNFRETKVAESLNGDSTNSSKVSSNGELSPYPPLLPFESPRVEQFYENSQKNDYKDIKLALERRNELSVDVQKIFVKYGLSEDLSNIAIIESKFDRAAASPQGALGIWQLMPSTARAYGLRVVPFFDERQDIRKSTEAVAAYLQDLFDKFGDWHLVLAAYNSGEGRILRAIETYGTSNFMKLVQLGAISSETESFVANFYAVTKAVHLIDNISLSEKERG